MQTQTNTIETHESIFDQLNRFRSTGLKGTQELRFGPGLPDYNLGRSVDIEKMLEGAGYRISPEQQRGVIVSAAPRTMRKRVRNEFNLQYAFNRDSTNAGPQLRSSHHPNSAQSGSNNDFIPYLQHEESASRLMQRTLKRYTTIEEQEAITLSSGRLRRNQHLEGVERQVIILSPLKNEKLSALHSASNIDAAAAAAAAQAQQQQQPAPAEASAPKQADAGQEGRAILLQKLREQQSNALSSRMYSMIRNGSASVNKRKQFRITMARAVLPEYSQTDSVSIIRPARSEKDDTVQVIVHTKAAGDASQQVPAGTVLHTEGAGQSFQVHNSHRRDRVQTEHGDSTQVLNDTVRRISPKRKNRSQTRSITQNDALHSQSSEVIGKTLISFSKIQQDTVNRTLAPLLDSETISHSRFKESALQYWRQRALTNSTHGLRRAPIAYHTHLRQNAEQLRSTLHMHSPL